MSELIPPPLLSHLDDILCRHRRRRLRLVALLVALGAALALVVFG